MAPDSKHRKDPTDPHLKFLTRSRRLILVTRDHMSSVTRISAEIHELSQSILAEHEESVRARQNVQVDVDPGEVLDENIQREVSFHVNDHSSDSGGQGQCKHERAEEPRLPIRCPHIPNLNIHRVRDKSGKSARHRPMSKVPVFPKGNASAIRIYQPAHFPFLVHKQSPRVKQEPPDSHRTKLLSRPEPHSQRKNKSEKGTIRFPVLANRTIQREPPAVQKSHDALKQVPVVKYSLPVYKAPMHIMQPPGYAPRIDTLLSRLEKKGPDELKGLDETDGRKNSAAPTDALPNISTRYLGRVKTGNIRRTKPSLRPPTRQTHVQHPHKLEFLLDTTRSTGRPITRQTSVPQSNKHERLPCEKTLNDLIITKSLKKEPPTSLRNGDGDERRKTLKRKETVILPKVNPCPEVSPENRAQHYHRPSYLITSPLPPSHLVPTASIESGLSLSPMPNIHQMTLTSRQTLLISGTPNNIITSSRPGSIIRSTPVQGTIPRLPKLVTAGEGSSKY